MISGKCCPDPYLTANPVVLVQLPTRSGYSSAQTGDQISAVKANIDIRILIILHSVAHLQCTEIANELNF